MTAPFIPPGGQFDPRLLQRPAIQPGGPPGGAAPAFGGGQVPPEIRQRIAAALAARGGAPGGAIPPGAIPPGAIPPDGAIRPGGFPGGAPGGAPSGVPPGAIRPVGPPGGAPGGAMPPQMGARPLPMRAPLPAGAGLAGGIGMQSPYGGGAPGMNPQMGGMGRNWQPLGTRPNPTPGSVQGARGGRPVRRRLGGRHRGGASPGGRDMRGGRGMEGGRR